MKTAASHVDFAVDRRSAVLLTHKTIVESLYPDGDVLSKLNPLTSEMVERRAVREYCLLVGEAQTGTVPPIPQTLLIHTQAGDQVDQSKFSTMIEAVKVQL